MTDDATPNRRDILHAAAAVGLVATAPALAATEPPPETTRLRLGASTTLCFAPQFVATELLRAEGFAQVEFVSRKTEVSTATLLGSGEVDISLGLAPSLMLQIDRGEPVVLLAGAHGGCYELFARSRIGALRDLKGKTISVIRRGGGSHVFLQMMLAYIGIDPRHDVEWREDPWAEVPQLLAQEQIDAFLGFPPEPQELRAKRIGRVIFNTGTDRPWSGYFCCMVAANRDFVSRHPVATKRALRAIIKGVELCAAEPEFAARAAAAHRPGARLDDVRAMVRDLRYARWRDFSAEDSARFFSLRLHETGMFKSSPRKLLAQGTDWHFIDQLRKELKA